MTSDNTSLKTNSQKHLCANKKNFFFDVDKKICETAAPNLFSSFMLVSVPLTPLSTFLDRWIFGEILCKFLPASQVGQCIIKKTRTRKMTWTRTRTWTITGTSSKTRTGLFSKPN